jgi:hypothetical protein
MTDQEAPMTMLDPETGWREATITINGRVLSFAQALSVRVAVSSFRLELADPAFAAGLGPELAANYDAHLQTVEALLIGKGEEAPIQ